MTIPRSTGLFTLVLLTLVLASGSALAVQASGTATLAEATDHSGTTVVFVADSPDAVTDSTLTDANGDYALDLVAGAYDVEYHHTGYVTQYQLNQLITADTVLPSIELLPISRILSGPLSGVLEAGKTYYVEGEVSVEASDTLTVEPGVSVIFNGDYSLTVDGLLVAVGTETDSITFTSGQPSPEAEDWGGIVFALHSDDNGRLEYCNIRYGSRAVTLHLTSNAIRHCTVQYARYGIYFFPDGAPGTQYPVIEDCVIEHIQNPGVVTSPSYAVTVARTSFRSCGKALLIYGDPNRDAASVIDCVVENCGSYGIHCASAFYGTISGTKVSGHSIGIFLSDSSPLISHCLLTDNSGSGIYMNNDSSPHIDHCTIANGMDGVVFENAGIEATIENCIIDTIFAISGGSGNADNSHFYYNCLITDNTNYYPANLAVPVMVNANGDSCDIYYNITLDPEWTDPDNGDYTLQETSPCIDAGNPSTPDDPDGTVADMGVFYFEQVPSGVPGAAPVRSLTVLQNYPNPFNPSTVISFDLPAASSVQLDVYDVAGRLVRSLVRDERMSAGPHTVSWDGKDRDGNNVTSGVYFYRVRTDSEDATRSMTLLK